MKIRYVVPAAFIFALSACASTTKQDARASAGGLDQSRQLLEHAREIQAKRGCAKAAPAYRVIASFGDGYEVAQYELGVCLLSVESASSHGQILFRDEGVFWLKRAAWAGNARAQSKLAHILSGEPSEIIAHVDAEPAEAMSWALVYHENSMRDLFGLPPVTAVVLNFLQATLSPEAMTSAAAFAENFNEIKMASFTPPPSNRQAGKPDRRPRQDRPEGQGRRRPR